MFSQVGALVIWRRGFHAALRERANNRCDVIAKEMWAQYQQHLAARISDENDEMGSN